MEDDNEREGSEGDGEGGDEDGNQAKQEYIKKEFVARSYASPWGTDTEVKSLIVKNQRPLMRIRISRPRRDFGHEGYSYIDRDAGESNLEIKVTKTGYFTKKKVLEMGLQAANQIKSFSSQTYYNRMVNAIVQYDPKDFISEMQKFSTQDQAITEKLDKFVDRVAYRVEEALQSNELINVFQDDFEMLGDEEAASAAKISTVNMLPRTFFEHDYCKNKRVSCIKFHPTKPYLVGMSMIENLSFDDRSEITGKSFDSHVLILNFSDAHIITLNYVLETPIEISTIEFHPENPNVIVGGCISGQLIIWDISSVESRITAGRKPEQIKMPDEEEDKTQQTIVKMKQLALSSIVLSHKNYVSDIQFIPAAVKVDRKNPPAEGRVVHFISVSEDGLVCIWDTRPVEKETLRNIIDYIWKPFQVINLFRQDGSGELGLSRVLFHLKQSATTFWAASDEGDLLNIDWSVKPIGGGSEEGSKFAEYVKLTYDTERNYRPVLALERSPFFEDLLLTVHDFHFAIWKTSVDFEHPIFRSANTFGSHNTCGAFSPTRAGVIFITKTDGIDVWDFIDQSNKPSLSLNFATSAITYFKFQYINSPDKKQTGQYMAYGDEQDGTLFLYEVPSNLRYSPEKEIETIEEFWEREIKKCNYVKDRRVIRKEEYHEQQKIEEIRRQIEEQQKDQLDDVEIQKELEQEGQYQELLMKYKVEFGLMSQEELENWKKAQKKKQQTSQHKNSSAKLALGQQVTNANPNASFNLGSAAYQSKRSNTTQDNKRRGDSNKRVSTPMSPIGNNNEKQKKLFPAKERMNQSKGFLASKAQQELNFHHSKYDIMRENIMKLTYRENFQCKNLRGLITYAKKLTLELDEYKEKVKMAEKIIQDLRNTGNESLDSLINMLQAYQQKQFQTQQEIHRLRQLVLLKDDEIQGLDEDITELSSFVSTAKDKLEDKIDGLLHTYEENRRIIRRQDKFIVDLQQKNEVSQTNIAETAQEIQKKAQEKMKLQFKLKELEDQKGNIQGSINNMESMMHTFRTIYAASQASGNAHNSTGQQPQLSQPAHETQQQIIQWKDAPEVKGIATSTLHRGDTMSEKSTSKQPQQNHQKAISQLPSSPLKSAMSQKGGATAGGGTHGQADQSGEEKFDEVLVDELKTDEWTIWEHYESLSQQKDQKYQQAQYLENYKKIAWFNDAISFWQVWNNLPIANLKNYFYDYSKNSVNVYDIKGNQMRISTMSMFLKGVEPRWEDKINAQGGEYQMRLFLENDVSSLEKVNQLWENMVLDLVTKRFPHPELIVGGRIVDKSFAGKEAFRMEIWVRFQTENDASARKIKEFMDQEYNIKNLQPQQINFKHHVM